MTSSQPDKLLAGCFMALIGVFICGGAWNDKQLDDAAQKLCGPFVVYHHDYNYTTCRTLDGGLEIKPNLTQ